ncbi:MAG: hypothetical protein FWE66_02175, partial [Oscillospiraceae bacterium]|nr:hypothetical protein [Oscillospiraceae bacterium]
QYDSFERLRDHAKTMGVSLSGGDVSLLSEPIEVEGKLIPNRFVVQPVECGDSEPDGAPGELTRRRYLRFVGGGAGLIWMEATAILRELKSHPKQLVLTWETLEGFKGLIGAMKEAALTRNKIPPLVVVQLSHPGRSCIEVSKAASDREIWDKIKPPHGRKEVASDAEIEQMPKVYGTAVRLAKLAGFDGVEIKACHQFFVSELLSARHRPGRYGGSFENRVRHLKEALAAARAESEDMFLTLRLNLYDGIPYPDGFGMKEGAGFEPDMEEPLRLLAEIKEEFGVELVNCSSSSPAWQWFPDVGSSGDPLFSMPDDPLKNGARMHRFASEIKSAIPEMKVVATGFSHLRQYAPAVGAGMIERGEADLLGFGRQALAYPDFVRDITAFGGLEKEKCCIGCGGCHRLLGAESPVGCVVRDQLYMKGTL